MWCRRSLLAAASAAVIPGAPAALMLAGATTPARADLPGVIAAARASVLPVGTYRSTDSPRFGFRGTGFVVGDGTLVATNFHVLPAGETGVGAPMVVVTSRSADAAQLRHASVVATDRTHDLALLHIEGPALPALPLDTAESAREGQAVALIGFPIAGALGFAPVTHHGIVSAITSAVLPAATAQSLDPRAVSRLREGNFEIYQLDATAYPGNSGGPLIEAETGRVLGIVNMVLIKGTRESALSNPTGISYAIPVQHLQALLREVERGAPVPVQTR